MTCRNSSMPNCLPFSSEMSITASLRVCMCTVGVSLYSSTASHPLAREEGDKPGPPRGGPVSPVEAPVGPPPRVDGGVGTVWQFPLHLRVVRGQPCQCRQVSPRRTSRYRNEIAVAAELVDIRA